MEQGAECTQQAGRELLPGAGKKPGQTYREGFAEGSDSGSAGSSPTLPALLVLDYRGAVGRLDGAALG